MPRSAHLVLLRAIEHASKRRYVEYPCTARRLPYDKCSNRSRYLPEHISPMQVRQLLRWVLLGAQSVARLPLSAMCESRLLYLAALLQNCQPCACAIVFQSRPMSWAPCVQMKHALTGLGTPAAPSSLSVQLPSLPAAHDPLNDHQVAVKRDRPVMRPEERGPQQRLMRQEQARTCTRPQATGEPGWQACTVCLAGGGQNGDAGATLWWGER
mmetsp:Transcript_10176/g.37394  ORF Transcript_10176/g.37394 Transcript_10176/m.37394 type:complete len:212 (-) Transcript_10176:821-1456(-)